MREQGVLILKYQNFHSVKVVERANTALRGSPQTQSIAEITIESINLKVPHLTPNDDIKLQLLTRIKADEPMMIPFRRWELHELPALTQGSTIEIWSVKTCSALDSPRYVIVFFQTKKADNLHEDVTLFDNANIKSIRLALNSDYYPQERMLLDFSRDQYADAHFNYTEFNKSYHNCQEKRSLVNFAEFKSRPIVKVVERANTALRGSPQTQSIAEITIESINLKVPHLTPNDDIKLQLLTRIKADEPMMIPFRRWELHELPALTQGSNIEIWSVKTCSALDSPRYVIVFFQTKKADNLHEDVTLFDNANIKSIRLALNSDYYPQERMLLDFSRDQYADAHFNYTEFNKSYHNCQEKRSLVNVAEFKSRPMFVIDCSRRYLGLKSSTVDIKKPHIDESIQKVEWRTYYPYVKSFRNNDVIEININQSDAFDALYESILHISGKVTRTEGVGRVGFVNNAGAYMFQSISYDQNGKELESHAASLAFSMFIPLKHLLNIFNDYECVSYGKHSIRLVRAGNDNNCFKITETAAGGAIVPTKVQLDIENV
ncbi:unnamed protein product [Phaedon cochleariae]|uniref:Double jelly roll-like domain-containing protein n=1 Tax=Phaedon cochleariae TaxID=80249 RepID=A0A9N9SG42_PHACE|nr:unnamed protein product [Phaedon cochleariae]